MKTQPLTAEFSRLGRARLDALNSTLPVDQPYLSRTGRATHGRALRAAGGVGAPAFALGRMEVAFATVTGVVVSACAAAVEDDPRLQSVLKALSRRARLLVAQPTAEEALQMALRGVNVAFDAERRSLDGSRRGLQPDDLQRIISALAASPPGTLLKLNLSHTRLCADGGSGAADAAQALAQAHLRVAALSALRLRGCELGDAGCVVICRALHHADATASARLTELALASNGLSERSARPLADAVRELPRLQALDLSYNPLGPDACALLCMAIVDGGGLVQSLSLASVGLDDPGTARVAAILAGTGAAVQRPSSVTELDLDGNAASDGGLAALLALAAPPVATLTSLRLSSNLVGHDGALALAAHLSALPSGPLRSLALANNPLGAAGCEAIATCLTTNTCLCDLTLSGAGGTPALIDRIGGATTRNRAAQRHASRQHTKALLRAASAQLADAGAEAPAAPPAAVAPTVRTAPAGAAAASAGVSSSSGRDASPSMPPLDSPSGITVDQIVPLAAEALSPPGRAATSPTGAGGGGTTDGEHAAMLMWPQAPSTPPDAPSPAKGVYTASGFDTPAALFYAAAHDQACASLPTAHPLSARFVPSFAPTGDLSAGVVRQRREVSNASERLSTCPCTCVGARERTHASRLCVYRLPLPDR